MSILSFYANFFNRSEEQVKFIRNLCSNWDEYFIVEQNIKNYHYRGCPANKEEIDKLLLLTTEGWFTDIIKKLIVKPFTYY